MFGNITGYIFGGQESGSDTGENQDQSGSPTHYSVNPIPPLSDGEEEWVVVAGGNDQPSLTLGSLNEITPRPPTGSTGTSSTPSDDGVDVDSAPELPQPDGNPDDSNRQTGLSRTERKFAIPFGSCPNNGALSLSAIKGIRAAQKSRNKDRKKHLSAKAIDRHNKAVKPRNQGPKKNQDSISLKSAGINKHLKQC